MGTFLIHPPPCPPARPPPSAPANATFLLFPQDHRPQPPFDYRPYSQHRRNRLDTFLVFDDDDDDYGKADSAITALGRKEQSTTVPKLVGHASSPIAAAPRMSFLENARRLPEAEAVTGKTPLSIPSSSNIPSLPRPSSKFDFLTPGMGGALQESRTSPALAKSGQPSSSRCATKEAQGDTPSMTTKTVTVTKAVPPHLNPNKLCAPSSGNKPDTPIRDKLSGLGVTITEPQPVEESEVRSWARHSYVYGSWKEPEHNRVGLPGYGKPDSGNWEISFGHRGRGCGSRRGSGRGRGRGGRGRGGGNDSRNSRWLNTNQSPKNNSKRKVSVWDQTRKDSTPSRDLQGADNDWNIEFQQPDNPDGAGYKLTGWDGNWAPPPIDWDSRPAFRAGQSSDLIFQWMSAIDEPMNEKKLQVPIDNLKARDGTTYTFSLPDKPPKDAKYKQMGDMVPPYWMPTPVDGKALQAFWHEFKHSKEPEPVEGDDLKDTKPWWERRVENRPFLSSLDFPPIAGVDPDETKAETRKRENDRGSLAHMENRLRLERAKQKSKQERQRKREEKIKLNPVISAPTKWDTPVLDLEPNGSFNPESRNLLLRQAQRADMQALCDIYNYYVENSPVAKENQPRTINDMLQNWHNVIQGELPFLVAVERREMTKARRRESSNPWWEEPAIRDSGDSVVGFVCAKDYDPDKTSIWRFAVQLEVYVHKDRCRKGVANCLMGKAMVMLDSSYRARGTYDVEADLQGATATRTIQNVLINLPYHQPEHLAWLSKWLQDRMEFQCVAHIEDVAIKHEKPVNLAIFRHRTGIDQFIDPPPM